MELGKKLAFMTIILQGLGQRMIIISNSVFIILRFSEKEKLTLITKYFPVFFQTLFTNLNLIITVVNFKCILLYLLL